MRTDLLAFSFQRGEKHEISITKIHPFIVLLAACWLTSLNLSAQTGSGTLQFNNLTAPDDKRIWVNDTGRVGDGVRADGTHQIALYWGPAGSVDESLMVQVGAAVRFLDSSSHKGTFFGGSRFIHGLPYNGAVVSLQARAWSTEDGLNPSYEAALLNGDPAGKGPIFDFDLKDPADPLELSPAIWRDSDWQGFAIVAPSPVGGGAPVPEPSTIVLGVLGLSALLLFRRRQ